MVNNKPGIHPATRQAVTAAVEALGYQSREDLHERRDRLVGMITPELENPIFSRFARAMGAALIQQGYTPALHTLAPGGPGEDGHVKTLLQRGASGIIFVSGLHADVTEDRDRYRDLVGRSLPMAYRERGHARRRGGLRIV
ncbi:hypothetical protein ACFQZ4_50615 [Catellatospora coxensis]